MTKEQAQFLVEVTEMCGNQDISLREGYSGRGMFGRETFGVVIESLPILLADVINYARDQKMDDAPDFQGFSTDNMGRDIIIY